MTRKVLPETRFRGCRNSYVFRTLSEITCGYALPHLALLRRSCYMITSSSCFCPTIHLSGSFLATSPSQQSFSAIGFGVRNPRLRILRKTLSISSINNPFSALDNCALDDRDDSHQLSSKSRKRLVHGRPNHSLRSKRLLRQRNHSMSP